MRNEDNVRETMLLIVPYGIETMEKYRGQTVGVILLIVPYGIETWNEQVDFAEQEDF